MMQRLEQLDWVEVLALVGALCYLIVSVIEIVRTVKDEA